MLGETIGEAKGRITSTRVLGVGEFGPKVEVSFELSGKALGMDATFWLTYFSTPQPGGLLYGEGQGMLMTRDGDTVSWTGQGTGRFTGGGKISWRGAIYFQGPSERLARLAGTVGVYEFDGDSEGNAYMKTFEWK